MTSVFFDISARHNQGWIIVARALVGILFSLILVAPTILAQDANEFACLAVPRASLRNGPSFQHQVNWQINQYMPLKILAKHYDWLKVSDLNQKTHWIPARFVSSNLACVVIAKPVAHIRSGPSTRTKLHFVVEKNTSFLLLDRKENWLKLDYYQQEFWVHNSLVWPNFDN